MVSVINRRWLYMAIILILVLIVISYIYLNKNHVENVGKSGVFVCEGYKNI